MNCARTAGVWTAGVLTAIVGTCCVMASPPTFPQNEKPTDPPAPPRVIVTSPARTWGAPGRASFGSQVNVSAAGLNIIGDAANEPSLAVDPLNPQRITFGWRQFDSVASNFREAGVGYSTDGGRTWRASTLDNGLFRSDPVLDSGPNGEMYYNSLSTRTGGFACDTFRSFDGGQSYGPFVPSFGGDKAWFHVDKTSSIGRGNIYGFWSFYAGCCNPSNFMRSTNGGASYTLHEITAEHPYFGTLTTGPDGELYMFGDSGDNSFLAVVKSLNAKNAAATPTFTLAGTLDYSTFGFYVVSSAASPNPGGLLGQGWIACDRSTGPRRGWLYVCWSTDRLDSDPLDVMFARSTDGGTTWSTPIRVNPDAPDANSWQWFGTMAVSLNGRIDVVYNSNHQHLTNSRLNETYYRSSSDGGVTWGAVEQLSATFDSWLGWPNQNKMGDYYDLKSDLTGAFLACSNTLNGEQDVYCVRIGEYDCNQNGVGDATEIASGAALDSDNNEILNTCEDRCPSDFNGDGFVTGDDFDLYVVAFEAGSIGADIDRDGFVTGDDFDAYVLAFETGC